MSERRLYLDDGPGEARGVVTLDGRRGGADDDQPLRPAGQGDDAPILARAAIQERRAPAHDRR